VIFAGINLSGWSHSMFSGCQSLALPSSCSSSLRSSLARLSRRDWPQPLTQVTPTSHSALNSELEPKACLDVRKPIAARRGRGRRAPAREAAAPGSASDWLARVPRLWDTASLMNLISNSSLHYGTHHVESPPRDTLMQRNNLHSCS
jgi:hypothetical protein